MKPLTTLGDALAAKGGDVLDWRAQLRLEGVERRPRPEPAPAPSSRPPQLLVPLTDILREKEQQEEEELARLEMEEQLARERDERNRATIAALKAGGAPAKAIDEELQKQQKPTPFNQNRPDRGYVDQSPPPELPPRRRVFVNSENARNNTGVALIRPNVSPEPPTQSGPPQPMTAREARVAPPLPPPERSSVAAALRVLTPVPSAPPEPEMPRAQPKKSRRTFDDAYKEQIARRVLFSDRPGEQARVAQEEDLSQGVVSQWTIRYKKTHPHWADEKAAAKNGAPSATRTVMSRPQPPSSRAQPVSSAAPANGARTFETVSRELQEALERVKALKRELRALLEE